MKPFSIIHTATVRSFKLRPRVSYSISAFSRSSLQSPSTGLLTHVRRIGSWQKRCFLVTALVLACVSHLRQPDIMTLRVQYTNLPSFYTADTRCPNSKRIGGIYNIQHSFKDIIIHDFYRGRNVKNIPFFFVNNVKTEKLYQKIYDNVILHKKRQTNNSLIIYLQYETETLSLYRIIKWICRTNRS